MAPRRTLFLLGASAPTLADGGLMAAPQISPLQRVHKTVIVLPLRHKTRTNDKVLSKQKN